MSGVSSQPRCLRATSSGVATGGGGQGGNRPPGSEKFGKLPSKEKWYPANVQFSQVEGIEH